VPESVWTARAVAVAIAQRRWRKLSAVRSAVRMALDGPRTVVELNGVKVTDYTEGQPVPDRKFDFEPQRGTRPNEGWFGLQNHSKNDVVFFKEVAIQKLK